MKRAAIIITDADRIGFQELHRTGFGEHAAPPREVEPSGRLLADLRMALKLMEGHRGHGYSPEQIAGGMNRLRAALEGAEET